ncbi:MAG: hypothetical protein SRB2_02730 [Desulfobacteraceae bacterium Eth-SRB2]|nr:MAG: hypothetical protein SRB2_02730 [Desulfobacteraceae bacterium Eth-SRB2]
MPLMWHFVLLPLSFNQFLSVLYPKIKLAPVDSISEFLQKKEENFFDLRMYKTELEGALHAFLQTGGFPSWIDARLKEERDEHLQMTFRAIIEGDMARLKKNASLRYRISFTGKAKQAKKSISYFWIKKGCNRLK